MINKAGRYALCFIFAATAFSFGIRSSPAQVPRSFIPAEDRMSIDEMTRLADVVGSPLIQRLLASEYEHGTRVPQNYELAAKWYRRAAEQGDAIAQSSLGFMYIQGIGVARNLIQAHKWLNLSVYRYYSQSEKDRFEIDSEVTKLNAKLIEITAEARESLAHNMTAAQIAEAQRLAREWKPKLECCR